MIHEVTEDSTLCEEHRESLISGSGISEEVIQARGYWTAEDPDDLIDLGFAKTQRRTPALVIPVRGTCGEVRLAGSGPITRGPIPRSLASTSSTSSPLACPSPWTSILW